MLHIIVAPLGNLPISYGNNRQERNETMKNGTFYYFSPAGGTKKIGDILCQELFDQIELRDLAKRETTPSTEDITVIAAPVFAGRIPAFVTEQLKTLNGKGKKAITLAVYGNRHYDDALLELNDVIKAAGFQIIASAAPIAQHSIVPKAGAGRPDDKDISELKQFAADIRTKLENKNTEEPKVPGNFPYRETSPNAISPLSKDGCIGCGACAKACPAGAITVENKIVSTNLEKCFLCMACTSVCPLKVRILPPPVQSVMNEKLDECTKIRRENEFYL